MLCYMLTSTHKQHVYANRLLLFVFANIVSSGDSLPEMSNPVFWEKSEKSFQYVVAENITRVLSVKGF